MDHPSVGSSSGPSSVTPCSDHHPPPHTTGGKKRPYQTRRKERSCDNCKLRKTKCDAHDDRPCTACVNAKLDCHFSSTEHEGRKMGPQRKIRDLERKVESLQASLREAQRALEKNQRINTAHSPTPSSNHLSSSTSPSIKSSMLSENASSTAISSREPVDLNGPRSTKGQTERDPISWNPNAFGPGSAPQFVASYTEYLQRLGFCPSGSGMEQGAAVQSSSPVPLLSDYVSSHVSFDIIPMDLRVFLPNVQTALRLLEIFRRSVQMYKSPFYWPNIVDKFNKAFENPLMENDEKAVGTIFCPVMMIMAVGSQLVAPTEIEDVDPAGSGKSKNLPQERQGWRYFELARKFLGLNNPVYTLEDAMVLVLMSLYLDKATLPSPCWMICGAMSRVCQDIGLHRIPPKGTFNNIQLESRIRLFWLAYVQDKRVSMKMGRPYMLRVEDCDVPHPGTYEYSGINRIPDDLDEAGGRCSHPDKDPTVNVDHISRHALQTTNAIINASKVFEYIHSFRLSNVPKDDISRLQEMDSKLLQAWNQLPRDLRDYDIEVALDVAATRSLFIVQHSRIMLFRHFTDFSHAHPIDSQLRSFCLQQSVHISKITARILRRTQLNRDFMEKFGVRNDDLVHLHIFRVAIILLWGLYTGIDPDTDSINQDLRACLISLDSIARVHITGRRFLQLYREFAKLFRHPTASFDGRDVVPEDTTPNHETGAEFPLPTQAWVSQQLPWESTPMDNDNAVAVPTALAERVAPASLLDPDNLNIPNIMTQVRNGDWNSFEDLLHWDPMFETAIAGGNVWNFN